MTAQVVIVTDYGYGDAGKGKTSAAFARYTRAHTGVRSSGGPQAVHYVVTDDGIVHGFSQFSSATFEGAQTYLSRFMIVSPTHLLEEAVELNEKGIQNPLSLVTIDEHSPITTLYHRAANWIREIARGDGEHGTCGMGIGELKQDLLDEHDDILFAGDLLDARTVAVKTRRLRHRKRTELRKLIETIHQSDNERLQTAIRVLEEDSAMCAFLDNCKTVARKVRIADESFFDSLLKRDGAIICEGAQGVLLDEDYGFHPHTTWTKTTHQNIDTLLEEHGFEGPRQYIGVFRTYSTRHGAGPFVINDASLKERFPELHNTEKGWQGAFRVGWFDLVAAKYAIEVGGRLDGLSITHVDRITASPVACICIGYRYKGAFRSELDDYFDSVCLNENPIITRIRPSSTLDLDRQRMISIHLQHCEPVFQTIPSHRILKILEQALGYPVAMESYGPQTSAAVFRHPLSRIQAA